MIAQQLCKEQSRRKGNKPTIPRLSESNTRQKQISKRKPPPKLLNYDSDENDDKYQFYIDRTKDILKIENELAIASTTNHATA